MRWSTTSARLRSSVTPLFSVIEQRSEALTRSLATRAHAARTGAAPPGNETLPVRRLVIYPALRERHEEAQWRASVGLTAERVVRAHAPDDLAAVVMARIVAQQQGVAGAQRMVAHRVQREGLTVAAATLVIAALLVLASGALVTLLAPAQALLVLGALLTAVVAAFELLRQVLLLLAGAFSSDTVILACAAVPAGALLVWYRFMREPAALTREA
ncbi:MAG: hypothetical protein ACHQ4H_07650 [Ktedonobacterales bacterium]